MLKRFPIFGSYVYSNLEYLCHMLCDQSVLHVIYFLLTFPIERAWNVVFNTDKAFFIYTLLPMWVENLDA